MDGTSVTRVTDDCERTAMTDSAAAPRGPGNPGSSAVPRPNPLVTHPITSLIIGLLVVGSIVGGLYVPIYARLTPKVGDWPFFYFYLLVYMPVVAVALWVVTLLQKRLRPAKGEGR
jgi:hypothetical protein